MRGWCPHRLTVKAGNRVMRRLLKSWDTLFHVFTLPRLHACVWKKLCSPGSSKKPSAVFLPVSPDSPACLSPKIAFIPVWKIGIRRNAHIDIVILCIHVRNIQAAGARWARPRPRRNGLPLPSESQFRQVVAVSISSLGLQTGIFWGNSELMFVWFGQGSLVGWSFLEWSVLWGEIWQLGEELKG